MENVLSKIAKPLTSIFSGIPQIELDRQEATNALLNTRNEAGQAQLRQAETNAVADQEQMVLRQRASQGDPQAMAALIAADPERALQLAKAKGFVNQDRRDDALRFLDAIESATDPIQQQQIIASRLSGMAGDPDRTGEDTASLVGKSPEEIAQIIPPMRALMTTANQADLPVEIRTREALIADATNPELPDNDIRKTSAKVALGTEPRAVGSSALTIANTPDATDAVAGSDAAIAGAVQGAKTEAQIAAELTNAGAIATAEAEKAALIESAVNGERIRNARVKTVEEALILLPDARAGAAEMVGLLTTIRDHPKLANILGAIEGRIDARIDPEEAELMAMVKQVTGKTFLQAYQSLKGGGPITDLEGRAATEAQSRLATRTVSVESYQDAIDELIGLTDARLSRLERKADPDGAREVRKAPTANHIAFLKANDTPENRQQFIVKFGALPEGF